MGGYGALRTACRHHLRFRAVSVHSSITVLEEMKLFVEEDLVHYRQLTVEEENCISLIRTHRQQLPSLRFDCGTEDALIEGNRRLHNQLTAENIPHTYEEFPGGHQWPYWQEHVKDSLLFFARLSGAE
jgi:enterochelin esterase-like enzyme